MDEEVRTATFDFRVLREGLHFPTGLLGIALADWEVPRPSEDDRRLVLGDRITEDEYYLYLVARWPTSMPPGSRAVLPDAP